MLYIFGSYILASSRALGEDEEVHFNETHCVYCGVRKVVCPAEGALESQITLMRHTQVHSGA